MTSARGLSESEELCRLRAENRKLKVEREILPKEAAYFAKVAGRSADAAQARDSSSATSPHPGPTGFGRPTSPSFRTEEGWLYFAGVVNPDVDLVIDVLLMAFERRRPGCKVIHHSDLGRPIRLWPSAGHSRDLPCRFLRLPLGMLRQRRSRAGVDPRLAHLADQGSAAIGHFRLRRGLLQPRTHPEVSRYRSPAGYERGSVA